MNVTFELVLLLVRVTRAPSIGWPEISTTLPLTSREVGALSFFLFKGRWLSRKTSGLLDIGLLVVAFAPARPARTRADGSSSRMLIGREPLNGKLPKMVSAMTPG